MRAYLITVFGPTRAVVAERFAGSQEEAAATRRELLDKYGLKRTSGVIGVVDIPTTKAALLAFLNAHAVRDDHPV